MKRHRMLDLAITWLPIFGTLILGSAVTIWYGVGSKNVAIWTGFAGAVILALGFSLHLQKIVWESEIVDKPDKPDKPSQDIQRAWLGIDVELAGPLSFQNGIGIPLKSL